MKFKKEVKKIIKNINVVSRNENLTKLSTLFKNKVIKTNLKLDSPLSKEELDILFKNVFLNIIVSDCRERIGRIWSHKP